MITLLSLSAGLCLIAVAYPYVIYPLLLALLPRRPIQKGIVTAGDGSGFSLLFCAFNEAASLPAKITNLALLRARYPKLEILAFDDGSTDGSPDLIAKHATFVHLMRGAGRNGKAYGMKRMAARATGEYLIFTDANVSLDVDAIDNLQACYSDPEVGGVCGSLRYVGGEASETARIGGLYWRLEEKIKALESSVGSVMGADGSIFSIRRCLYPEFPDTVLDDFTVSMEVVFSGARLIKAEDVVAYEKLVSARRDEFARKIRIAARAFHTHRFFAAKRQAMTVLDRYKYFSHKTIRWLGGLFLLGAVLGGGAALTLVSPAAAIGVTAIGAVALSAGMRQAKGGAAALTEIILAMAATLIGVAKAAKGQTFATWSPAKSRSQ